LVNGPLRWLISAELASFFDTVHSRAFDILLILIAIHILAIAFYRFVLRDDLLSPMLTGRKALTQLPLDAQVKFRSLWLALGCLLVAGALVWTGVNFGRW